MEKDQRERLQKVAIAGAAAIAGGAIVRYARKNDVTLGYMYRHESGTFKIGRYKGAKRKIMEFAGVLRGEGPEEVELEESFLASIDEGDVQAFEKVVETLHENYRAEATTE